MRQTVWRTSNRVSTTLGKMGLGRIPGVKSGYNILNRMVWMFDSEKIRDIQGSKMYLDPLETDMSMRTAYQSYINLQGKEQLTTDLFAQCVKTGMTVIDVGANIGYYTLLAARLVGDEGMVLSFEPNTRNFNDLCRNIDLNRYTWAHPYRKAVSNGIGTMELYSSHDDVGAHTLRKTHDSKHFNTTENGQSETVQVTMLDFGIPWADVVKMDCEGSEYRVWQGMTQLRQRNPDMKLFIEFWPQAIKEMGDEPSEFINDILSDGYKITCIDELRNATNLAFNVPSAQFLMEQCADREKIVNLFVRR